MKPRTAVISTLLILFVALDYGCAAELGANDTNEPDLTRSALSAESDDASDATADANSDPGCEDFLKKCRKGNVNQCKKYSESCKVRVGVIGDSLSDEYQGVVSRLPGLTWTEQLHAVKRVSFGGYEANPSVRGEPRNDGNGRNFARFGQAALSPQWSDLTNDPRVPASQRTDPRLQTIGAFDAQISGLAAKITRGKVDVALVWIGHNDLFIRQYIGYDQDGGQQAFLGALITKIVSAAATLRAAASQDPAEIKTKVAIIGLAGAASSLNPALSAAAASAGIPFIDSFNTATNAIVTEQASTGNYDVGGTLVQPFTIVLSPFSATPKVASLSDLANPGTGPCGFNPATNGTGCATPNYAGPFSHYDGVHPNTLYQGVAANQIVTDVNTAFGFAIKTIPEDRLLDNAGL
ncbi:MAG TPA: SGNH/GDSL hydrolase family protein [Polyangiales bacterium]|nr:SGNH/GDSL hydrolase family protein [Polyangiales bacterium]